MGLADPFFMRDCGDCGLCCKLLKIVELDKPMFCWCPHFIIGKGCDCYDERPQSCRDFDCLWRLEQIPENMSPLRTKVVASVGKAKHGDRETSAVYLYEDVAGNAENRIGRHFNQWLKRNHSIIVLHKSSGSVISPDGSVRRLAQKENRSDATGVYSEVSL
jgi:hypothetical protein